MGWNVGFFFLPFVYIKDAIDQALFNKSTAEKYLASHFLFGEVLEIGWKVGDFPYFFFVYS